MIFRLCLILPSFRFFTGNSLILTVSFQAMNPLDFDAFVMLLGYKTIELDPEDVLIEALSKWDVGQTGLISESKLTTLHL